ncbi:MAG: hydrogenase nickel incorporation protein HypB [Phycisphaeraceae bacterium]|nr:hydrogenase nickel incorporation protein HypB [Phycisphaeraceae bacterium]
MDIPIIENVLKLNDEVASINRKTLKDAGVYTVDLIGSPGSGKTSLLEATFKAIGDKVRIGVLVGDLTTARDATRIAKWCPDVVQINTGKGCHLDANQVRQGLDRLKLDELDILIIENVGNLICPVGFDLGQDAKVGLFSIAEGDDKAAKHPYIVQEAQILLLNKMDLLPHVTFDLELFKEDVARINPKVSLQQVSATQGLIAPWCDWLLSHIAQDCTV